MNDRLHILNIFAVLFAGLLLISACQQTQTNDSAPIVNETASVEAEPTKTSSPTITQAPPTVTNTPTQEPTITSTPTPTIEPTPTRLNNTTSIVVQRDIKFGIPGEEQKLDAYFPVRSENLSPVILMLHQGGGSKEQYMNWGRDFAEEGFTVIASNFRGYPYYSFPTNLQDAYCALSWIYENADEYEMDTENIFVLGHSSGGTLSGLIGVIEDDAFLDSKCFQDLSIGNTVKGVITFTGIFDYRLVYDYSEDMAQAMTKLMGASPEDNPTKWEQASAVTWVDGSEPPFLLIHGEADENILPEQSEIFTQVLESVGVPVELVIVPEGTHHSISGSDESFTQVLDFLQKIITK